jgi:hypothetical protein
VPTGCHPANPCDDRKDQKLSNTILPKERSK